MRLSDRFLRNEHAKDGLCRVGAVRLSASSGELASLRSKKTPTSNAHLCG